MNATEPTTPAESLQLAKAAQAECRHADAERWGLRAATLAGEDDPEAACLGRKVAGVSWLERSEPRRAVRLFRTALATVDRVPSLAEHRGAIAHHLFCAHGYADEMGPADLYFRRASRAYASGDPRRLALASDRAFFLLRAGQYQEAAEILPQLIERAALDAHPLRILAGNTAVALAGAGRRPEARGAVDRLRRLLEEPTNPCGSWGWLALGWALALLGEIRDARAATSKARRVAAAFGEEYARGQAARLLRDLSGG